MSLGIDLGNRRTTFISDTVAWSALGDRHHHLVSAIAFDNGVAVVGDATQSIAAESSYEHVYTNFVDKVTESTEITNFSGQSLNAFDLTSLILLKTKYQSTYTQSNTVLSVAEHLANEQKLALAVCAQKQGFEVKAVISQCFAKALALLHREKFEIDTIFAVYDWEDNCFCFGIYKVTGPYSLETLATQCTDQISQQHCDKKIWAMIAEQYKLLRGRDLTEKSLSLYDERLKDCKDNLEKYGTATIEVRSHQIDLSFDQLLERTKDLVQQSLYKIDQALRQAHLIETDLNGGVYVLGVSSQSNIENGCNDLIGAIKEFFTVTLKKEAGIGLAAKGAAIFGLYYLNNTSDYCVRFADSQDHSVLYLDRTLHHYGIVTSIYDAQLKTDKDQNYPLIEKNQRLPIQYNQKLHTDDTDQTYVDFEFTTSNFKTNQLDQVVRLPLQQIGFSIGSKKLVELSLDIAIDLDHRITCLVRNSFTGETKEIVQADATLSRYQQFQSLSIAVQ